MTRVGNLLIAIGMVALLRTACLAEDVIAPINGVKSGFTTDTGDKELFVEKDNDRVIAADDLIILQGDPDTIFTVDTAPGQGVHAGGKWTKHVAVITKKAGAVVYKVVGHYVANSGGGGVPVVGQRDKRPVPDDWMAQYQDSRLHIHLVVNDALPCNAWIAKCDFYPGCTVTVSLVGPEDENSYSIALDAATGNVIFEEATVVLGKVSGSWKASKTVKVRGTAIGQANLRGICTGIEPGNASARVYEVGLLVHGVLVPRIALKSGEKQDVVVRVWGETTTQRVPLSLVRTGTVSSTGGIPGTIEVEPGASGGCIRVDGPGPASAGFLQVVVTDPSLWLYLSP